MKEFKEVEVGGRVYLIGCLKTSDQIKVGTFIAKLMVPTISAGMAGADISSIQAMKETVSIPSALSMFADRIEEAKVLEVVQKLAGCASRLDKTPMPFETYWAGELTHLTAVLAEVMEVNYGDFFGALKEKAGQFMAMVEALTKPADTGSKPDQ